MKVLSIIDNLRDFLNQASFLEERFAVYEVIAKQLISGRRLIACGNGGSMTQAQHLAEELAGRYSFDRRPYDAVAITDPSYLTCVSNDYGFEQVFSRAVEAHCGPGDVVVLFSTSGNSKNLLLAAEKASLQNSISVAFNGAPGSSLGAICDYEVTCDLSVPKNLVQIVHVAFIHELIEFLQELDIY